MQKIYGIHTVVALLQTKPKLVSKLYLQGSRVDKRFMVIYSIAEKNAIPIKMLTRLDLDAMLPTGVRHQGVIVEISSLPVYFERDISTFLAIDDVLLLILDGVQDPHNLGACLRSANALGVHAVIAPKNRAVGLTPTVRKIACGAAELTPFIAVSNLSRLFRQLKKRGVWLVGTSGEADTLIADIDLLGPLALVMGGEEKGLRRLTKKYCDYLTRIPTQGSISSFNVSVATGICLYEINRQRIQVE